MDLSDSDTYKKFDRQIISTFFQTSDNHSLVLRLGPNVIKLLKAVIYSFSYEARVLVTIGQKSLPRTNIRAITKIHKLRP